MYLNLGLIGRPLSHSKSPMIQTYLLNKAGLNGGYNCFELNSAEEIPDALHMFERFRFRGINITVPYKSDIIKHLDSVDAEAEKIGAVNTVKFEDGQRIGYNTDIYGFEKLMADTGATLSGKDVLLLGCGGAAKAVLSVLKSAKPSSLTVVNRDIEKVKNILTTLNFDNCQIYDYNFIQQESRFHTVINSTSAGLETGEFFDLGKISVEEAAVDLQYADGLTPFLKCFQGQGIRLADGFSMLFHQAYEAFRIWTGARPEYVIDDLRRG